MLLVFVLLVPLLLFLIERFRGILFDTTDGGYFPLHIVPMLVGEQGVNLNVVLDIRTQFKKNKIQA